MLKNEIYSILLNHKDHKIEEVYNNKKIAIYDVIILGSDNFYYEFKWQVERYDGQGSLKNCWLTTAVSNPVSLGASIQIMKKPKYENRILILMLILCVPPILTTQITWYYFGQEIGLNCGIVVGIISVSVAAYLLFQLDWREPDDD